MTPWLICTHRHETSQPQVLNHRHLQAATGLLLNQTRCITAHRECYIDTRATIYCFECQPKVRDSIPLHTRLSLSSAPNSLECRQMLIARFMQNTGQQKERSRTQQSSPKTSYFLIGSVQSSKTFKVKHPQ